MAAWSVLEVQGEGDSAIEPSPRVGHSLCAYNGDLILFGGASYEEGFSNELWRYSLANNSWENCTSKTKSKVSGDTDTSKLLFPEPRYEHSCQIVNEKFMLIIGGNGNGGLLNDVWVLDLGEILS